MITYEDYLLGRKKVKMDLFNVVKAKLDGKNVSIVFPEGIEPRILGAAVRLKKEGIVEPVLVGDVEEVQDIANKHDFDIAGIRIESPKTYEKFDQMVEAFVERRKGKVTAEEAREMLQNVNYFGTMLCYMGEVSGMVSGSIHSTGETVKPALQIIKTKEGVSRTSGAFIMISPNNERYLFADCAINITLTADEMAEVAVESAKTAQGFDIDPRIAMLSFSTKGSANADEAKKVEEATKKAKELNNQLVIDGELQFDAAIVPSVGKQKAPNSEVAGNANVFIFPSLEAGNIGYKIAQRLGGFEAIGPILQGLNKPVNDLSRGCNEEDVYKLALITAVQSL